MGFMNQEQRSSYLYGISKSQRMEAMNYFFTQRDARRNSALTRAKDLSKKQKKSMKEWDTTHFGSATVDDGELAVSALKRHDFEAALLSLMPLDLKVRVLKS